MTDLAADLHPLFVHLPIAGWLFAAALALWPRRGEAVDFALGFVLLAGTLGALPSVVTGLIAHEPYEVLPVHDAVSRHQLAALGTTLAFMVASVLWLWDRRRGGALRQGLPFRGAVVVLTALVLFTGWSGGYLVYEEGLNTPADPLLTADAD
jgi:uncharacterized membrane protein